MKFRKFSSRIALLLALAACALPARAQQEAATFNDTRLAQTIFQCLAAGLPDDWERAFMILELPAPNSSDANVRYMVARSNVGEPEVFQPCDARQPAQALLDARQDQAPDRRGWTGARLAVERVGKFEFNFDYPEKK
jgi:hypothetical protein